jgi:hypothetical protein
MNYRVLIISLGALLGDLLLGTIYPFVPPLFLIIAVFYFAKNLELYQVILLSLSLGFIFEMSKLSGSLFAVVFLAVEAISIRLLTKKVIDINNKPTQVIFLLVILIFKAVAVWLVYDRSLTPSYLLKDILISIIVSVIISLLIMFKNAKRAKIL